MKIETNRYHWLCVHSVESIVALIQYDLTKSTKKRPMFKRIWFSHFSEASEFQISIHNRNSDRRKNYGPKIQKMKKRLGLQRKRSASCLRGWSYMQSSNGSMLHLQGKTSFTEEDRNIEKGMRKSDEYQTITQIKREIDEKNAARSRTPTFSFHLDQGGM